MMHQHWTQQSGLSACQGAFSHAKINIHPSREGQAKIFLLAWMMKGVRCMKGRKSTRMRSSTSLNPSRIAACSESRTLSGNGSSFSSSLYLSACANHPGFMGTFSTVVHHKITVQPHLPISMPQQSCGHLITTAGEQIEAEKFFNAELHQFIVLYRQEMSCRLHVCIARR